MVHNDYLKILKETNIERKIAFGKIGLGHVTPNLTIT